MPTLPLPFRRQGGIASGNSAPSASSTNASTFASASAYNTPPGSLGPPLTRSSSAGAPIVDTTSRYNPARLLRRKASIKSSIGTNVVANDDSSGHHHAAPRRRFIEDDDEASPETIIVLGPNSNKGSPSPNASSSSSLPKPKPQTKTPCLHGDYHPHPFLTRPVTPPQLLYPRSLTPPQRPPHSPLPPPPPRPSANARAIANARSSTTTSSPRFSPSGPLFGRAPSPDSADSREVKTPPLLLAPVLTPESEARRQETAAWLARKPSGRRRLADNSPARHLTPDRPKRRAASTSSAYASAESEDLVPASDDQLSLSPAIPLDLSPSPCTPPMPVLSPVQSPSVRLPSVRTARTAETVHSPPMDIVTPAGYEVEVRCVDSREADDEMRWEVVVRKSTRTGSTSTTSLPPTGPLQLLPGVTVMNAPPLASSVNLSLVLDQPSGKLVFISLPVDTQTTPTRSSRSSTHVTSPRGSTPSSRISVTSLHLSQAIDTPPLSSPRTPAYKRQGLIWSSPGQPPLSPPADLFTPRRSSRKIVAAAELDGGLYARASPLDTEFNGMTL